MGFVYKITNNINGKSYIGKTETDPVRRYKKHWNESRKESKKHRPLYRAFKKYGIKNFTLEILESSVYGEQLCKREIYYIDKYDTFRNGYNCTSGGEGKSYLDYDLIYDTYIKYNKNYSETAKKLKISKKNLKIQLLQRFNEPIHQDPNNREKSLLMFSKNDKLIKEFSGTKEALSYLQSLDSNIKSYKTIHKCCNGKRKTAHGYIWKYK